LSDSGTPRLIHSWAAALTTTTMTHPTYRG
jgi:hypothetical protein